MDLKVKSILAFFFILFLAIGAAVAIIPWIKLSKAKRSFDVVMAKCIRVAQDHTRNYDGESSLTYKPIWEYEYNGETHESSDGNASYLNIPVGTEREIYVSPDNPEKICVPYARDLAFTTIFGAIFMLFGVGGIVYACIL